MITIDPTNINEIARALREYPKRQAVVAAKAINQTAQATSSEIARTMRDRYGYKVSDARRQIAMIRANQKNLTAYLRFSGRGPLVIEMSPQTISNGVRYKIGKQTREIQGAFFATMPGGHRGVFIKSPTATHRTEGRPATSTPNLKIMEQRAPGSAPAVTELYDGTIRPFIDATLRQSVATQIARELSYQMRKARRAKK